MLFSLNAVNNFAQDSTASPYKFGFDTNYVVRYNDRLAISIFQSQRTFDLNFSENFSGDSITSSALKYIARSNKVTGITIAYDKLSVSVGISTPITESEIQKKGKTTYYDYGISFTSYKYRIEAAIRNYKGFYEENTANYDTNFTESSPYFIQSGMSNMMAKVKYFYFFKKRKFSYGAAYNNTYRQLKSKGSFFVYGDGFYNSIYNKTAILPIQVAAAYKSYADFNYLQAYGLTTGGGYTLNVVLFKSLYVNGTVGLAAQFYQQNIALVSNPKFSSAFKAGFSAADLRGVVGYNGKNFYIRASIQFDIVTYKFSSALITSNMISGAFAYGYRFKFREREWMKKVKNSKLYRIL